MKGFQDISSLGSSIARTAGTAATGFSAIDVAYNIHAGNYVDAGFGAADYLLGAVATYKFGFMGTLAGVAFEALGGTKAVATGGAVDLCLISGLGSSSN